MEDKAFFKQVYEKVKLIPFGKVTSYSEIARSLETRDFRKVGWAMAACKDESVPCHRVVKMDGTLAKKFGFGGAEEQKSLLEAEGIEVNDYKVDMEKFMFRLQ